MDEFENMEIADADGRLFWQGSPVVTGQIVTLQNYERILATIGALGALAAGLHSFGVSFGWW